MYKILLVDDEELVLKSLVHTVEWEKYGFEISDTASSGKEAYEKIMNLELDLVMTDIRMQGIGGLELIQLIRQEKKNIYFVILSGYAEFAYAKKALELGAVGYCLKPFQEDEITSYLRKIKGMLDERKKTEKNMKYSSSEIKEKKERKPIKNQTFIELARYVDGHYMDDISPQNLAEIFHINVSYLSQLFKKESGITYTEYLTNLRIKQACKLLGTTDTKIVDIAELVGFHDYFYFTRVFKKVMSMSPTEYRDI